MKMKLRDAIALKNALDQLDAVRKEDNTPVFAFRGGVRLSLTTKVRAVRDVVNDFLVARRRIEQEMKITPKTPAEDPELWMRFDAALGEVLDAEVDLKLGQRIRTEDLDLDKNPLTSALILALDPILVPLPQDPA